MSNENNNAKSGSIGFCGLLTIAFIVLKLCGVITWSWVWVLAPLWIPTAFFLLLVIISLIIAKFL
jgi:hypothetical protein